MLDRREEKQVHDSLSSQGRWASEERRKREPRCCTGCRRAAGSPGLPVSGNYSCSFGETFGEYTIYLHTIKFTYVKGTMGWVWANVHIRSTTVMTKHSSPLKSSLVNPLPNPGPQQPTFCRVVLPFLNFILSGIMHPVIFCVWLDDVFEIYPGFGLSIQGILLGNEKKWTTDIQKQPYK